MMGIPWASSTNSSTDCRMTFLTASFRTPISHNCSLDTGPDVCDKVLIFEATSLADIPTRNGYTYQTTDDLNQNSYRYTAKAHGCVTTKANTEFSQICHLCRL